MSKPDISVVIPARNERWLEKTLIDVLSKAEGKIEVVCVCDGYRPDFDMPKDDRLRVIYKGRAEGMRPGINSAVAIAEGEYILKCDGHVLWDQGYDVKILEDMQPDWLLTPLRKRLDPVKWEVQPHDPVKKPDISVEYLSHPSSGDGDWGGPGLNGRIFTERILATQDVMLQDVCAAQGSAWVMNRKVFNDLQLLDTEGFGPFWNENQEQTFAITLRHNDKDGNPGRSVSTRKTWFAHNHKGKPKDVEVDGNIERIGGRGYTLNEKWLQQGRSMVMKFFAGEKVYPDQKRPLSYLVSLHHPMPGWDDEKLEALRQRERNHGWDI